MMALRSLTSYTAEIDAATRSFLGSAPKPISTSISQVSHPAGSQFFRSKRSCV